MGNSIGGNGGPADFRPINIGQALDSGTITEREARELRRIDTGRDGTVDKADANLDDGNTTDDTLELNEVNLGRNNPFNNTERRRQALAGAFFATQDGALRDSATKVLQERVRDDAHSGPRSAGTGAAHVGQGVDKRSLAQVTAMCTVAAEEWSGADGDTRAALTRNVATTLFEVEGVDARQRQIWSAALAKLPPELAGAVIRDNAEQLSALTEAAVHRGARLEGDVTTAHISRNLHLALEMSPPLRVGGPTGPTLAEVAVAAADEQMQAGNTNTAARIVDSVRGALSDTDRAALYHRLCHATATSGHRLESFGGLRRDMYQSLSADRAAFTSRQQALFATEILTDMRATGADVLRTEIEAHLEKVGATMGVAHDTWVTAAQTIGDARASEDAKLAAIASFCDAARGLGEDELYEALLTPPPGAALDYPEPEWIGVFAHLARGATTGEDHRALLDIVEARFTNLEGNFHPEAFRRLFAAPLTESLGSPGELEVHQTLTAYLEHPERIDSFDLESVRQAVLAEHGVYPGRGESDDPLQSAVNQAYRHWKAGETAKDVGLVALQVGAVVGANVIAPILGGAVTAGLVGADFIDTVETINLAHALNDVGAMTDEEKQAEDLAAVVGLGLSIAGSVGTGRVTKGVSRLAARLLRRGVPRNKIVQFAFRMARNNGVSKRLAREYAENLAKELGSDTVTEELRDAE